MKWNELDLSLRHDLLHWHAPIWEPLLDWGFKDIGDLSGKQILEIGSGDGGLSCLLGLCGADVWATDISIHRLQRAQELATDIGVSKNVRFILSDAYCLPFCVHSFDLIVTRSVLVLLDRTVVLPIWAEFLTIPHGQALFVENLHDHPMLKVWRGVTRQQWGHHRYLSLREIDDFKLYFATVETKYAGILLPVAGIHPYLEKRLSDPLLTLDNRLINWCPGLKALSWLVAIRTGI